MKRALVTATLLAAVRIASAQPDPGANPPANPPTNPNADPNAPTTTPPGDPNAPVSPPTAPTAATVAPLGASTQPTPTVSMTKTDLPTSPSNTDPPSATNEKGLRFGSYGRIIAGDDLHGGKPEATNIVAHGPRIVEPSYLELDFSYGFETPRGMKLRPVVTLAFDGTLFHDTGEFDAHPALRNVYLDAQVTEHTSAWVGSRMYRGDDIYLFDYWPLDDLNTVGGGLQYRADALEVSAHAGVNRLNNQFQFQEIQVANPTQGATTAVQLNRQRLVASLTASYTLKAPPAGASIKLKAHGEVHALPSGTFKRDDGTFEALPADSGFLAGVEASVYGLSDNPAFRRHLNVYARYAKGLASFDELTAPTTFGRDLKTSNASEVTIGAAGNWDHELGNVMIGALSRRFVDADTSSVDYDDGWEYAIDARPLARVAPDVFAGVDVSYQARFPRGLNPNTESAEDPAVFQIAPMLVYSPMGPSSYDRPQLRLVYRASHLNQAALDTYVPDDIRHGRAWVSFLGVEAEWWFNSSTYR
ncbi:MAG TPA: carbohydrate porin [Kofleriaceae bacterium]|jgi:maltoporin